MIDLKEEYLKMYNELLTTIEVVNNLPYTNDTARLKLDYVNKAAEILEKYSKLS